MKYLSLFILITVLSLNASAQDTTKAPKQPIYTFVQQMPQFPGGDAKLIKFLSDNIRYPNEARENGIQGTVTVQFVVNEDGSLSDVKALKTVAGGCTEEAIRVVKAMPEWQPAMQNKQAVKVYYNLPVTFKLNSR